MQEEKSDKKTASSRGRKVEIKFALHLVRKNPLVLIGAFLSIASVVIALISNWLVPANLWKAGNLSLRLCWNNAAINWHVASIYNCPTKTIFILGTDSYGRDLLKMMVLAFPLDLEISFAVVVSAVLIGTVIGSLAAYVGGHLDELVMRVTDIFFAFPGIVLAIVIVSVYGRTLPNLTIAVLIVWWPTYARLVRSQILSEKEKSYVEALRSLGAGSFRVLFRHLIPNSIYPVVVQMTLDLGGVIVTFSGLMFLGFSPNPMLPELGNLVSDGILYVTTAPWLVLFPGLAILVIALGFSLLGDGIRDVLDPRLRR